MALKLNPLGGALSLGKAIGLQTQFKNDYTGNRVVEEAFSKRNAAQAKEKDLFSPLDVKVDYTKVEPYWAEKIQKEVSNWSNAYAAAKRANKDNAFAMVQPQYAQSQAKIAGWLRSNEEFGKYKTQSEDHYKNSDLITKVRTPGVKDEEVFSFNETIGNVQITPDGMFSYEPIKQFNEAVKFDPRTDFTELTPERVPSKIPGYYQTRTPRAVVPTVYQQKIEELSMRPDFQKSVIMEFPELKKATPDVRRAKTIEVAKRYVDAKMPPITYDYKEERIPTSGEGSGGDKREKPQINGEFTESLLLTKDDGTRERRDVKYPWSVDVPNAKETSVPLDSRVIDYETNSFLKGDDVGKVVTFKPKKIYPQLIKSTGKTELYVIGTAQVDVEDRRKGRIVKEFSYKVPYDKVDGAIKGSKYDLSEVEEKFKETKLVPESGGKATKQIKSSDISARAKAAGYTDQEYRKLLTEKGVKIID